jgi:2-keto-3-deoxy-L-rhamnonate aldolase RhmA
MNLTLQSIPSPIISEIIATSHLDGVVLDTEHGHFNNETLYNCIQIVTLSNKKCFVRFTDLNKQLIRMCLDAGIDGVIFSTIESYEVGLDMIKYCTYPTHGGLRGSALVRENNYGELEIGKRKPIIIGQIETKKGVDNLHNIMNCGFDYFVIGPYDLSASLGCTAEWDNKLYIEYTNTINNTIPASKLGAFLPSKNDINRFIESGKPRPSLLIWGLDVDFLKEGLKNINII